MDEGHQDGDGLEQGEVLDRIVTEYVDDQFLPEWGREERPQCRQDWQRGGRRNHTLPEYLRVFVYLCIYILGGEGEGVI